MSVICAWHKKFMETVTDWWIGRNGPIPQPPPSPDIAPLTFSQCGHAIDIEYQTGVLKKAKQTSIFTPHFVIIKYTRKGHLLFFYVLLLNY